MGLVDIGNIGPDDSKFDLIEDPSGDSSGLRKPGGGITPAKGSVGAVSEDKNSHFRVDGNGKATPVDDSGDTIRKRSLNLKKILIYGAIAFVAYKLLSK